MQKPPLLVMQLNKALSTFCVSEVDPFLATTLLSGKLRSTETATTTSPSVRTWTAISKGMGKTAKDARRVTLKTAYQDQVKY